MCQPLAPVPTRPPTPGLLPRSCLCGLQASVSLRPWPLTLRVTPVPAAPPLLGLQGTRWGGGWRGRHPRGAPWTACGLDAHLLSPHSPCGSAHPLPGSPYTSRASRETEAQRGLDKRTALQAPAQSPGQPARRRLLGPFPQARSHVAHGVGRAAGASPHPPPPPPLTTATLLNREPKFTPGLGPAHPEAGEGWGESAGSGVGHSLPLPSVLVRPRRGAGTTEPAPRTGTAVMPARPGGP